MNLPELKSLLDLTGFPVTYSHFTPTTNNPAPNPPYICYLSDNNPNFIADNKVFHKISNVVIELYTVEKDLEAEGKLEELLDASGIPYVPYETFIETEKLFQKIYEVRLI